MDFPDSFNRCNICVGKNNTGAAGRFAEYGCRLSGSSDKQDDDYRNASYDIVFHIYNACCGVVLLVYKQCCSDFTDACFKSNY